ncbi:ClpXP protease specificity-enhancing factor SspB [uncultured Brevundimonas sp.]|uniref:ClpXP protease specificity-enhancing factor SspB n=1 Tax=uncultured Brevundimonas sp. TaxID=213418 RepID=UPI0025FC5185|nr:ClpXP protease specificity-enhancing factor SspB [uncultured Brevundimonas sp.]
MTDQTPPVDEMDYETMTHEALRTVIRDGLLRAASPAGLPGAHHFYITFKTRAADVSVPPDILAKYPDEMTVVIQHQYEDLDVQNDRFSVKLRFGGIPRVLAMPYTAVTRFYDPSVQFMLQWDDPEVIEEPAPAPEPDAPAPAADGPKVVSLDQFRKK